MAMARLVFSQSLSNTSISGRSITLRILSHHRHRSGKANSAQFIEVDLESSSSSSSKSASSSSESADFDTVNGGIKKLEDVIQSMIVRRAAPDWLPFRPGASYWVPPVTRNHPYSGVFDVIGRLSSASWANADPSAAGSSDFLSDDEMMSFSSDRGWPSSSHFVQESAQSYPIPLLEVKIVGTTAETVSSDSDEEG